MIPEEGRRLGPYEILGSLGGGAMGVVFRAWDSRLHREVALKMLQNEYQMPGMRERFLQEARAASALNHPNICTIFDIGEQDGEPYMVMELLEGQTLKAKIAQGALSAEEIVLYTREIADALSAAHGKGIVHRDIKPANIFLVRKGERGYQAKVLDFGLAKIDMALRGGRLSRALDLTLAGSTVGTLSYMSPEQARGKPLDSRSDLFSLGVVMYEMATRQVPFQGTTSALIFVQLLSHAPEPVHTWNDSIPRSLERVILKLLSKEREQRYQNARELIAVLDKLNLKPGLGWGRKGSDAAVPLVRALDPVANVRKPSRPGGLGPSAVRSIRGASGSGDVVVHPLGRRPVSASHMEPAVDPAEAMPGASPRLPGSEANLQQRAAADPNATGSGAHRDDRREDVGGEGRLQLAGLPGAVEDDAGIDDSEAERSRRSAVWVKVAAAAVGIVVAGGLGYMVASGRLRPRLLNHGEPLLLTVVQDKTAAKGTTGLGGAVTEGLELALEGSHAITVRGGEAYRAGVRQIEQASGGVGGGAPARAVAQKVGAKAYVYGEVGWLVDPAGSQPGEGYKIDIEVLDTESNDRLAAMEERVKNREGLPDAIERLAGRLRSQLGEGFVRPGADHGQTSGSLDALVAYAGAEAASDRGDQRAALDGYRKASSADGSFVQPHLKMAWIYAGQRAEVAAAQEAKAARDAAAEAGSARMKVMAETSYALLTTGDLGHAANEVKQLQDDGGAGIEAAVYRARLQLARGEVDAALESAQQGYKEDPYCVAAYLEAEKAMLELNRYAGVLELASQAERLGLRGVDHDEILAAYLSGDQQKLSAALAKPGLSTEEEGALPYGRLYNDALYLDDLGQTKEAVAVWTSGGDAEGELTDFASARAALLATGALDRAVAGACDEGMALAATAKGLAMGPLAGFRLGAAEAMCGQLEGAGEIRNHLEHDYAENTKVKDQYLGDIDAAIDLRNKNPQGALQVLAKEPAVSGWSLATYLKGLAQLAESDPHASIPEFQLLLDHRGAVLVEDGALYPMAERLIAQAYGAMGDKVNAAAALERLRRTRSVVEGAKGTAEPAGDGTR